MQLQRHDYLPMIRRALHEDIGRGDVTSELTIAPDAKARCQMVAREPMVVAGQTVVRDVFHAVDPALEVSFSVADGDRVRAGQRLALVAGSTRHILTAERTALNFVQHLSGIATLTAQYVQAVRGTKAVILDTRKTTPGLRVLEKYAVTCGGGQNHRMRLDDAILIKDNHIAAAGSVTEAVTKAKTSMLLVEAECDDLAQVKEALEAGADRLLLDNMDVATLREAVALVDGRVPLEASGGVNLQNVAEIAATGVAYISVGALTHSARNVDIGLDYL